jgi:hypothetical protein
MPERERELTESAAGCGASTRESFASYDRATSSWRTSQLCLDGEWSEYSETWPKAGMTRSGIAYERATLVRRIEGSESGLWPTIRSHEVGDYQYSKGDHSKPVLTLTGAAKMFPTPVNKPGGGSSLDGGSNSRKAAKARGMWPTPNATDGSKAPKFFAGGNPSLPQAVKFATPRNGGSNSSSPAGAEHGDLAAQIGGQLNPTWVEWLMGYPLGWTDCGDSGTRSSRKSRNSSGVKS